MLHTPKLHADFTKQCTDVRRSTQCTTMYRLTKARFLSLNGRSFNGQILRKSGQLLSITSLRRLLLGLRGVQYHLVQLFPQIIVGATFSSRFRALLRASQSSKKLIHKQSVSRLSCAHFSEAKGLLERNYATRLSRLHFDQRNIFPQRGRLPLKIKILKKLLIICPRLSHGKSCRLPSRPISELCSTHQILLETKLALFGSLYFKVPTAFLGHRRQQHVIF